MTHTLLMRLQGPMQAWGVQSRFSVRETTREPTKSGVIGLLCAALGRPRDAALEDLYALRMGARVDREGTLMVDFQTARRAMNAEGKTLRNAVLSNRYYLADAVFLVGLEGQDLAQIQALQAALRRPRWLLNLGRRAFPPALPVWLADGVQADTALETALTGFPWLVDAPRTASGRSRLPQQLRYIYEDSQGLISRADAPVSFAQRTYVQRRVSIGMGAVPGTFLTEGQGVECS